MSLIVRIDKENTISFFKVSRHNDLSLPPEAIKWLFFLSQCTEIGSRIVHFNISNRS